MKVGETTYIGDGLYLHCLAFGFELRADDAEQPSNVVYVDDSLVSTLVEKMTERIEVE